MIWRRMRDSRLRRLVEKDRTVEVGFAGAIGAGSSSSLDLRRFEPSESRLAWKSARER